MTTRNSYTFIRNALGIGRLGDLQESSYASHRV